MAVNPALIQWKWNNSFHVLVGDDATNPQKNFRLPRTVFTERSTYFRTALAYKPMLPEPILLLPNHDPAIFESYIEIVYAAKALTQVQKFANELGDPAAARLVEDEIARIQDLREEEQKERFNPYSGHFQNPCYPPDNYQSSGQGPSQSDRSQYLGAYAGTPCQSEPPLLPLSQGQPPFMPAMSPSTPSRPTGTRQRSVDNIFSFKSPK